MVVTTGNKSEMSVGYATLYGDMNGGFNPIKDLYKTEVFRLARLRKSAGSRTTRAGRAGRSSRERHHASAERGIAETRPTRTLPPYDILDQNLSASSSARSRPQPSSPPASTATL